MISRAIDSRLSLQELSSGESCPIPKRIVEQEKVENVAEGRAASKSLHTKLGYFLSISHHAVSANIIPNSADGIFSLKTEGTKT